jgi:hypothetical protein
VKQWFALRANFTRPLQTALVFQISARPLPPAKEAMGIE